MERSAEVEAFAARMYELMRAGDGAGTAGLLAEDGVLFVGTDGDEWWDSPQTAASAFREQLESTGGFDIHPGEIVGYADGDVGWVADRPTMRIGDVEVPMRSTSVLHREHGEWRIVQGHLSVAANINQDLFG